MIKKKDWERTKQCQLTDFTSKLVFHLNISDNVDCLNENGHFSIQRS